MGEVKTAGSSELTGLSTLWSRALGLVRTRPPLPPIRWRVVEQDTQCQALAPIPRHAHVHCSTHVCIHKPHTHTYTQNIFFLQKLPVHQRALTSFFNFPTQVQEQTREPSKNPFLRKKRSRLSEFSLVQTVQQIPGVGKVKAPLLLQKFPSIQQLSNASIQELEEVVGRAVAQQIHTFFTQPKRQQPRS